MARRPPMPSTHAIQPQSIETKPKPIIPAIWEAVIIRSPHMPSLLSSFASCEAQKRDLEHVDPPQQRSIQWRA